MSGAAHHSAVFARLDADPNLAVYDLGQVPVSSPPMKYAVVVSSPGDWSQSRFTGKKTRLTTTHWVYCVGTLPREALWVGDRTTAQLLDVQLSIAGRNVFKPSEWSAGPVRNDLDGLFPLPFAVISFDLVSEPA